MHIVHGGHFWQFGSITSLATEITDSSSFFGPNMASEEISECLILKIFLGEHPPTPPWLVHEHLSACNGHTSLK